MAAVGGVVPGEGTLQEQEEGGGDTVYAGTVVGIDGKGVRMIADEGHDSSNALVDVLIRTVEAYHQEDGPDASGADEMAVILLPDHGS